VNSLLNIRHVMSKRLCINAKEQNIDFLSELRNYGKKLQDKPAQCLPCEGITHDKWV